MFSGSVTIACVVEGHGEVPGLPKLLYRIARKFSIQDLRVPTPYRIPRGRLLTTGGIEHAVDAQARRVESAGGILVVLDADDDYPPNSVRPSWLGARGRGRTNQFRWCCRRGNLRAGTLPQQSRLAVGAAFPATLWHPKIQRRSATQRAGSHEANRWPLVLQPTVDQAILASAFDMKRARKVAPSFDKFCREVEKLIGISSINEG